jgi:mono/diheme cytochrome c family protein
VFACQWFWLLRSSARTAPFGADFWKANDDAAIAKVIVEGKGRMPAVALSPEETKAVVEYMKSSFKK